MRRKTLILACAITGAAFFAPRIFGQVDTVIQPQTNATMQWYRDAKFGMFIHWGLYAGPAQGEWYMQHDTVSIANYRKYAFPPTPGPGDTAWFVGDSFLSGSTMQSNWLQFASAAGFKYVVLTARHHEGYALFDSVHPNTFCSGQTLGKNLYSIYHSRCLAAGLHFGLYFSLLDWRYPGYFDVNGTNCLSNVWGYTTDPSHKENARLMKEELYAEVTYLMRTYSPVEYLFWDGGYLGEQGTDAQGAPFWESGKYRYTTNQWQIDSQYADYDSTVNPPRPLGVMGICRKYSPNVIANSRSGWQGDMDTREGYAVDNGNFDTTSTARPWERECCYNQVYEDGGVAWGYTSQMNPIGYANVVNVLTNCLIRDGNLLLNFGPDRQGNIPIQFVDTVLRVGTWLSKTGDGVYGTRAGPWQPVTNQYGFTKKSGKIFIHLLPGYSGTSFTTPAIPGGNAQVTECYDLNAQAVLSFTRNSNGGITITGINRTIHPPNSLAGIYMGTSPVGTLPNVLQAGANKVSIIRRMREIAVRFSSPDAVRRSGIAIFTLQGRQVTCPISRTAMEIAVNTSMLKDGIYLLKVKDSEGNCAVSKIIIQ